jgi:cytoskeletal protein CcmA (bactofilin family)
MAVFNKSNTDTKTNNSTTIISQGTKIVGEFNLSAKLHIEGEIEGKVTSNNLVSIGKTGVVSGELKAEKLLINGKFSGKVQADVVEITKGGELTGDIVIKDLIIEQGGRFEGTSTLKDKQNVTSKKS